jgi:hypothetical protein
VRLQERIAVVVEAQERVRSRHQDIGSHFELVPAVQ